MIRHASTILPAHPRAGCRFVAWLLAVCTIGGCSRSQGISAADVASAEEAWVASACTPAAPDFSLWRRRQVSGVTIAIPPGYTPEQGPKTNIGIRGPARRSGMSFAIYMPHETRRMYDSYFFQTKKEHHACSTSLSGYPADVIAWYDRGQYGLFARWDANEWGGEDAGKFLVATIVSPRVEEARELRTILHTMRPVRRPLH